LSVLPCNHQESGIGGTEVGTEYVSKFRGVAQPAFPGKAFPRNRHGLGCQSLTSFGPSCFQDQAASLGLHAGTKAVPALAFEVTGLKSSFHYKNLILLLILNTDQKGAYSTFLAFLLSISGCDFPLCAAGIDKKEKQVYTFDSLRIIQQYLFLRGSIIGAVHL